ncbi:imelysin family protein [Aquincola sp. MAHUQ-54]|uniref:Imelysin family protein n=1 Tax=Aquincola agrisoli TaxID=3119538 RepID=A0AAW9QE81_9BURK
MRTSARPAARWLAACTLAVAAAAPGPAAAQPAAAPAATPAPRADVAVPFYTPVHALQALYSLHYLPRARAFADTSAALATALAAGCDAPAPRGLDTARAGWRNTMVAWESLSAVQFGPLVERRSSRRIDFQPPRPELIARAIQAAPAGEAGMARVGAPAKGLPALEWLLWTRPVAPRTAECRFALAVARDLQREAALLAQDFQALAERDWGEEAEAASTAFGEFINQWLGGIERLRWADIEKPVRSAEGRPVAWPRHASGHTALAWQARWQALQALSAGPALPIGEGGVPIEAYLRGRGLNPLADALGTQVAASGKAVASLGDGAAPQATAAPLAAARELGALKSLIEKRVAPALEVAIGFSDADGD